MYYLSYTRTCPQAHRQHVYLPAAWNNYRLLAKQEIWVFTALLLCTAFHINREYVLCYLLSDVLQF